MSNVHELPLPLPHPSPTQGLSPNSLRALLHSFFLPAFLRKGKLTLISLPFWFTKPPDIALDLPGWARLWGHRGSPVHARLQVVFLSSCAAVPRALALVIKVGRCRGAKAPSPRLEEEASGSTRVSLRFLAQSSPGSGSQEDMQLGQRPVGGCLRHRACVSMDRRG